MKQTIIGIWTMLVLISCSKEQIISSQDTTQVNQSRNQPEITITGPAEACGSACTDLLLNVNITKQSQGYCVVGEYDNTYSTRIRAWEAINTHSFTVNTGKNSVGMHYFKADFFWGSKSISATYEIEITDCLPIN